MIAPILEKIGRDIAFIIMGHIQPTYWRNIALASRDFALLVAEYRATVPSADAEKWSRARIREHKMAPTLDEIISVILYGPAPRLDSLEGGTHPAIREMVCRNDPSRFDQAIYLAVVNCMNNDANPELLRIFVDELCCRNLIWKTLIEEGHPYNDIMLIRRRNSRTYYDSQCDVYLAPLNRWSAALSIWSCVSTRCVKTVEKFLKACPPAIRDVLLILVAHCRDNENDGYLGNKILCKLMSQIKYRGMRCSIAMRHKYYPESLRVKAQGAENASCEVPSWKHPHSFYCATEKHRPHAPGAECGPDGA